MSWLTTDELERAVQRCADSDVLRHAFRSIYPHIQLPILRLNTKRLPVVLIVNTDTHNLPGQHWISIYIDRNRKGELFDSLANPPSTHIERFLNRYCTTWVRNRCVYQPSYSSYCGVYVLLHVLRRAHYPTFKRFCASYFTDIPIVNDLLMRDYYNHHILPHIHHRCR